MFSLFISLPAEERCTSASHNHRKNIYFECSCLCTGSGHTHLPLCKCIPCLWACGTFPQASVVQGDKCGLFRCCVQCVHVYTQCHTTNTQAGSDQTDAIWESPKHSAMVSLNWQCSFHLFILRQSTQTVLVLCPSDKTQSLHSLWNVSVEIWEGWAPGVGLHQIRGPSLPYRERVGSSSTERARMILCMCQNTVEQTSVLLR